MSEIEIKPEQLANTLEGEAKKSRQALELGARAAALKLVAYLVNITDQLGITDRGVYKAGFRADGSTVYNDAPHAGIVELGARPHPVSEEGQKAIRSWVIRKLGADEADADNITFLICRKIAEDGQAPRYVMRDALEKAHEFYKEEVNRIFERLSGP